MIPSGVRTLTDSYFKQHSSGYDMSDSDECGRYMEALVPYCQHNGFPKVGLLKYTGSGTKYNGHRIDSFLYNEPVPEFGGKLQSCDVIANAETNNAQAGWSPDEPRYSESDWLKEPIDEPTPGPATVPWVPYNEAGFQELKRTLAYDYARRPQGADFDVTVWSGRYFHNSYMGPERIPLGENAGLQRARNEWCNSLHVSVIPVPPGWNIGDPV